MKRRLALFLAVSLALALSGCGATPAPTAAVTPTPAAAETRAFTDSAGRTVELPAEIGRIAPTGPLAQMALLALAPDLFAGISAQWEDSAKAYLPEAYHDLPVLGQLYGSKGELNLEELAAAGPQVIIDVGEAKGTITEDMDALSAQVGIPFVHITAGLETMPAAFRKLGELLGREERAETLAAYCEKTWAEIGRIVEAAGQDRVKALYCLGEGGNNVIAKGSYHGPVFDLLADNVAVVSEVSSKGTGNEVGFEQLLLWDPAVIVFAPGSAYEAAGRDPVWQELTAIRTGRYCEVPLGPYNWMGFPPSVQRYLGLLWLAKQLYPQYADYDLYEKAAEYFDLFYHKALSRAQFDALTARSLEAEKP